MVQFQRFTEGTYPGEFLISVANGQRSYENVTVAAEQDFGPGSLVAQVSASGEFVVWNPEGTDGSENVAGVTIYGVKTGENETTKTVIIARDAEVLTSALDFGEASSAEIEDAIDDLRSLGIIPR